MVDLSSADSRPNPQALALGAEQGASRAAELQVLADCPAWSGKRASTDKKYN